MKDNNTPAASGSRSFIRSLCQSRDVTLIRNGVTIIVPSAWPGYQLRQMPSQGSLYSELKAMELMSVLATGERPPAIAIKPRIPLNDVRLDALMRKIANKVKAVIASAIFANKNVALRATLFPAIKLANAAAVDPPTATDM